MDDYGWTAKRKINLLTLFPYKTSLEYFTCFFRKGTGQLGLGQNQITRATKAHPRVITELLRKH
jgi:hypothetical protein